MSEIKLAVKKKSCDTDQPKGNWVSRSGGQMMMCIRLGPHYDALGVTRMAIV